MSKRDMAMHRRSTWPRTTAKAEVAEALDGIKNSCYRYAAQSGLTISIEDVKTPPEKKGLLDKYEKEAEKVETQFRRGIITDGERREQEVRIWTDATDQVRDAMERGLKADLFNPIEMMVGSGARGNMMQVRQIAGMRGLVANPRGDMIPRPIKSNFREGLAMLEYFIATPGARKGLVDTALRTADSGYLTRRLVDVAQELIVRERRLRHRPSASGSRTSRPTPPAGATTWRPSSTAGRCSTTSTLSDGTVHRGQHHPRRRRGGRPAATTRTIDRVRVRSVLTCDAELGICALCYGRSLATGNPIELGEAVGVIAAQSIGEPGTQLTMRTFHTGGVAGQDIAGGLPRVVELFEARTPRGAARLARTLGRRPHRARTRARADARRSSVRRRHRGHLRRHRRLASAWTTARRSRPASPITDGPLRSRRSSWRSRASARPSCTSSKRSRRSTATRACRSTTSTSS